MRTDLYHLRGQIRVPIRVTVASKRRAKTRFEDDIDAHTARVPRYRRLLISDDADN